jgi:hypothetical protein
MRSLLRAVSHENRIARAGIDERSIGAQRAESSASTLHSARLYGA